MASKKAAQWSEEDRDWLGSLPPSEREVALQLAAYLDARPIDEDEKEKA